MPFFAKLGVNDNMLMVVDETFAKSETGAKMYLACRNSQLVHLVNVAKVSAYYLLQNEWLVFTREAFEKLLQGFETLKSKRGERDRLPEEPKTIVKAQGARKKVTTPKKVAIKKAKVVLSKKPVEKKAE